MDLILNYDKFNPKNIQFEKPINNLVIKGGKHVNITYNLKECILNKILLKTPIMLVPFGIKKYDDTDIKNKNKYYIDLSFQNINNNNDSDFFLKKMKELDTFIISESEKYLNEWDLKKDNLNIEKLYVKQIRYNYKNTGINYPPTFKIKIKKNNTGFFNTKIITDNKNIENNIEKYITPNSHIQIIMQCNGLWSINNNFGLTWKVKYLKLFKSDNLLNYSFIDNDNHDDLYLCDFNYDNEEYIDYDMDWLSF
jgi:hypothetical protein